MRCASFTLPFLSLFAVLGCSDSGAEPAPDVTLGTGGDTSNVVGTGGDTALATGGSEAATGGTGTGGTATGGAGAMDMLGMQADPGTDGDGTFDQPEPYSAPPEALGLIGGAPQGSITANAFYDSPNVYPELTFEYSIYVPAQYQPGKPAALMVFQDGAHYTGASDAAFNSQNVFDNLIHEGTMPVTIALFINPGSKSPSGVYQYPDEVSIRSMQYDTPTDVFSRFLIDEAIPDLVLSKYDIVKDPEGWAIGGHSSGGIASIIAAWSRPDVFRKVLSHNASFPNTGGVLPQAIADEPTAKPIRIYLLSGTGDINNGNGSWFDTNTEAAMILEAKGYHYRYRSGVGDHYPPRQAEAVYPEALRWLWRGYSLPWYQ